jgi:hypothetical protein
VNKYFVRHIALPTDHGSWVFILSPLLIGLVVGKNWTQASFTLVITALVAFLIRQPVTIAVKAYSGRKSKRDLTPAGFWIVVYGCILIASVGGLIFQGYAFLLWIAIPAALVFGWHLLLIRRRSERRQAGIEVVGSGVLALAAPAAYWVGKGYPDPAGWWLFGLIWLQSAASIIFIHLRLEQRELKITPSISKRFALAQRSLLYTSFNFFFVLSLSLLKLLPPFLSIPYVLQLLETLWGVFRPAIGVKPTYLGFRQLAISTIFTLLFILFWSK